MNSTDDLMQQLLRAADDRNVTAGQEKQKLLDEAIDTIRDLRDQIHRWPGRHVIDAVDGSAATALLLKEGQCPQEQSEAALKDAADMIRDLVLVRENGIEPKAEE